MRFLRTLDTDGTFNQALPFTKLLEKVNGSGQVLHGFDLSAATDRLPIDLQVQILSNLIPGATHWAGMLNID